ncbi:MAG TPA: CDP-alcohol phosphatidyltransferase family protein [bacterium]|nr:CDP-alcohol phosphatidyltransferase family protein [bacterium]HPN44673.1 CDP-alcohol phosphatidyltransferase family protein [bacterium]
MKILSTKNTLATPANLVTFGRILLLLLLVLALPLNILWVRIACFLMIPVIFYMDSLDGFLARKLKCASKLGGVLDVAGDRIVENVLWVLLAYLRVIPVWIPILVLVRGFITDGFRSVALAQGYSTFAMMKSKIEWWLVASPLSRSTYAVLKALLFTVGVGVWSFNLGHIGGLMMFFQLLLGLTVCQCLVRGVYTVKACLKTCNIL